jgi:hypothetical protein
VKVPIPVGERINTKQYPRKHEKIEDVAYVPYESVIVSLMYAMVCTQPNISHALGVLSRYISTPRKGHWTYVKRVFRYLCGTCYMILRKT